MARRAWTTRGAVAVVVAACALPAVAGARPGDQFTDVRKPAEGAVLNDVSKGVDVEITCPTYHQFAEDFIVTKPAEGYTVRLSAKPPGPPQSPVGPDGEIVTGTSGVPVLGTDGQVEERPVEPLEGREGWCRPVEDDAGRGLLPPEPGRYWLQVRRECAPFLCHGGFELSEPVGFTVRRTVCTVLRAELRRARTALRKAQRTKGVSKATRRARSDRVRQLRARARVVHRCTNV